MSDLQTSLLTDGFVYTQIKGTSMNPMLYENRDKVLIKKVDKRLKKGDVALYKRGETYILHRVMRVYENSYTFCGDNQIFFEYGVKDEDVLGVLTAYYKGNKFIELDKSFKYKLYLFFYAKNTFTRKIRALFKKIFSKKGKNL